MVVSEKRVNEDEIVSANVKKKAKLSYTVRVQLKTDKKFEVINAFLASCRNEEIRNSYIDEYLEHGGNCLELLQLLEEPGVEPTTILEISFYVLPRIISNHPILLKPTLDACRYLLNSHIALINKMLNISSSIKNRKVMLKVLTVLVTFSSSLARDILLHVDFNKDNLRVLSKSENVSGDSVRNLFLQFLTAFFIDGDFPLISLVLQKQILLNSVIGGLQYDVAETLCFFITTLKTKVLENDLIYRTLKMEAFSTAVVNGLVKLYDWVGPKGSNSNKIKSDETNINKDQKDMVVECIHSFLLVLCTSHKHGIIFIDKTLGFGRKHLNSLLYSIVINIKSPWDHFHKADLVTKICIACPDMIRRILDGLVQYLEPKNTPTWMSIVDFACGVIRNLTPNCIEKFAKDMNEQQILQIVKVLIIPASIVKKISTPEEGLQEIINKILSMHCQMLKTASTFIKNFETWYDKETFLSITSKIRDHVFTNFLSASSILSKLEHQKDKILRLKFLESTLEIFELYDKLCPSLLQNIPSTFNVEYLLKKLNKINESNPELTQSLKIKCIKLFYIFDLKEFGVNEKMFAASISILSQHYFDTNDIEAKKTLVSLFKFTGIFEGCHEEIDIWINAILNLKKYDNSVLHFMSTIIRNASYNLIKYSTEIASINDNYESNSKKINLSNILTVLSNEGGCKSNFLYLKDIYYSPLLLAAFEELKVDTQSKYLVNYINFVIINLFHLQTNPEPFIDLISKNESILSSNIVTYITSWKQDPISLTKIKGKIDQISILSDAILSNNTDLVESCDFDMCNEYKLSILQMLAFYIMNLGENLTKDRYCIILKATKFIIENNHNYILNNTRLINMFFPTHTVVDDYKFLCTSYIMECIRMSQNSAAPIDLTQYQKKLTECITKLMNKFKGKSYPVLKGVMESVGLNYLESYTLIEKISEINCSLLVQDDNTLSIIYDILVQVLKTLASVGDSEKHLALSKDEIITNIFKHFIYLNTKNINTAELSKSLLLYLKKFPHCYQLLTEDLFTSILGKNEYCKDNSNLAGEILLNCPQFINIFEKNFESISTHKGLFLLLLDKAYELKVNDNILKKSYNIFEAHIIKALEKPQKANQHFQLYYQGVCHLIRRFMTKEKANPFLEKNLKFDCVEEFHVSMLRAVYEKFSDNETHFNNLFNTFVHLTTNLLKQQSKLGIESNKTESIVTEFITLIDNIEKKKKLKTTKIKYDDSLKSFCILLLKFGVSEKNILIKLITKVTEFIDLSEVNAQDIIAMMISHSDFFNYIFNEHNDTKKEVFELFLVLIKRFPNIMHKEHLPFLLGGYSATINPSDVIILQILQCYESEAAKTNFFDFKPLLWGAAARNHYTVRSSLESALWKQPKISDVLGILRTQWVHNTIYNYPIDLSFRQPQVKNESMVYDLSFLYPLFSQILLPENKVQTLTFAKSGALSLIIVGLSCNNEEIRKAACHLIDRFYNHLYVNLKAKFNALCIRFIEALCRGTAAIKKFKLNHFSSTFFALMSFVITNPLDPMYIHLTTYLASRPVPNLATIPEFYTFLHSSETNFKELNLFVLKILDNGLRTANDFDVFKLTNAQKLLLEYYSSAVSDSEMKNLVLSIFKKACKFGKSATKLCTSFGFIPFLNDIILNNDDTELLSHVIYISHDLVQHKAASVKRLFLLYKTFLNNHASISLNDGTKLILLKGLLLIQKEEKLISADLIKMAAIMVKSKNFDYLYNFNCHNYYKPNSDDSDYYLKELVANLLK